MGVDLKLFECNYCKSKILLKLQVEDLEYAPILFYCPKCNNKIYGSFHDSIFKINNADMINYMLTDENDIDYTFLYAGYFPMAVFAGHFKMTPFLYFFSKSGNSPQFLNKNMFLKNIFENKNLASRLNNFYLNNFEAFKKEFEKIGFESSEKLNYEIALSRFDEQFFVTMFQKERYFSFIKNKVNLLINNNVPNNPEIVTKLISKVNNLFKKQINFFDSIVDIFPKIRSFISISHLKDVDDFKFYNVDYSNLKQFYIDLFEINCNFLELYKLIVGETNVFSDAENKAFQGLNGTKIKILSSISELSHIQDILDYDLRNRLGHKNDVLSIPNQIIYTNSKGNKKDYSLFYFYSKILENIELFFANMYCLIAIKVFDSIKKSTFKYELKNVIIKDSPLSLKLNHNFINSYISAPSFDFDFSYWNFTKSFFNKNEGYSVNFEKDTFFLYLDEQPIFNLTKNEHSRWFRLALKKKPKLEINYSLEKLPLYMYVPMENSPFNLKL